MKKMLFILVVLLLGVTLTSCGGTDYSEILGDYVPSESIYQFSDENLDKVSLNKTFEVDECLDNAKSLIKPNGMFQSGMCLQRDAVNCIFGTALFTDYIAVSIKDKVYYGTVDSEGNFEVYLPKMNAGGPYVMEIISEMGRIVLTNVYIGEVYLFAGQSNMEWQIWISGNTMKELYEAPDVNNENIRLIRIPNNPSTNPKDNVSADTIWYGATAETVKKFSAVAYVFGKKLQQELGCPVGLVSTAVGGSCIEHWLSEANYGEVCKAYTPVVRNDNSVMAPTIGYNGILHPLKNLNFRGVVWYQGCSNTYGTEQFYGEALKIFMNQCREDFNNENLTFTICELARYQENPYAYSIINERINAVAKEDGKVAVARNLDLGNWFDIHPLDKRVIGTRAIDETLRLFYGKDYAEPIKLTSYSFNEDGSVTLTFNRDASLLNGSNGFEVSNGNKYSYDCNVVCEGNTITVSTNYQIASVRYGYTCRMNNDNKNDVSKMVTVYDSDNNPLDLFVINLWDE